jgi:hypothetical protein
MIAQKEKFMYVLTVQRDDQFDVLGIYTSYAAAAAIVETAKTLRSNRNARFNIVKATVYEDSM